MPEKTIESVIQEHSGRLLSLPGVVGVAEGQHRRKPCIKVYVAQRTPDLLSRIPSTLEGHRVVVEETGELRAMTGV